MEIQRSVFFEVLCLLKSFGKVNKKVNQVFICMSQGLMCKHLTSRSNWNLEVLVFMEEGKPENPEKNLGARTRTKNKLNPRADHWNRSRVTEVGGECSHHYANLAPRSKVNSLWKVLLWCITNGWLVRFAVTNNGAVNSSRWQKVICWMNLKQLAKQIVGGFG